MFGRSPYVSLGRVEPDRPAVPESRQITLANFPQLASLLSPMQSAGVAVTETTALNYSAWWNGVDIISSQVAVRPRILYRRLDDDSRERAQTHQVYRLLHDEPNEYMTPFVFWQTVMYHVLTWGNGYAEIEFDNAQRPIALWPIMPGTLTPKVVNGSLKYLQPAGGPTLEAEDVLHFPGLGFDGICGYSVLHMARASLGLSMAAERYGASFFGNGAWPGLVLQHPGRLKDEDRDRIKASLNENHAGSGQAHKAMIIEENMSVEKVGIPPEDAQFLSTREYGVEEMARWFNLPPHKLKHKSGERPGGNIETEQIEFETDTLLPWFVRVEQECSRKLVSKAQRSTFYVEHLIDTRSRAVPTAVRYQAYGLGRQWGFLSTNDIRRSENMNDIGPEGDRYLEPVNMHEAGQPPLAAAPPPPAPAKTPAKTRMNPARQAPRRALLVDAVGRFVRRESAAAKRASKRGPQGFQALVQEFYAGAPGVLAGCLEPAVRFLMELDEAGGDPEQVIGRSVAAYLERSKDELLGLKAADLEAEVERRTSRWEVQRPVELADQIATALDGRGEEA